MNILSAVLLCIVAALLSLFLRQYAPEYAALLSLGLSVLLLLFLTDGIRSVLETVQSFLKEAAFQPELVAILIKCLGICIIAELGSQSCRDAWEQAIASKVELAARVSLILISLPLFRELLNNAGRLLQ